MDKNARQIQAMFDQVAPRYDLMNRVMTFGMDQRWRRKAVAKAAVSQGDVILDLAAGTGDIALEIAKKHPQTTVIAGDFSQGMLEKGRQRRGADTIYWVACDAMNLPFADQSFDVVIFGYLLRNVADLQQTLKEIHRVLKPGGRVVCLDTTPPPKGILAPFINAYLSLGLRIFAKTLASDPTGANYRYLRESTMNFLSAKVLAEAFENCGFSKVDFRLFNFRVIALHWGIKECGAVHKNPVEKG